MVYALISLPGAAGAAVAILAASGDSTPPPWSMLGMIVTLVGALVYVFRQNATARDKSDAEKYTLGLKVAEALTASTQALTRALDVIEEEPRPRPRTTRTR